MSKHTPGPWHADSVDRVRNQRGIVVARCGREERHEYMPHDEQSANARLIAASPELLEALREITDHFADVMGGPLIASRVRFANGVEGIPTIAAARAAIAKATGEA